MATGEVCQQESMTAGITWTITMSRCRRKVWERTRWQCGTVQDESPANSPHVVPLPPVCLTGLGPASPMAPGLNGGLVRIGSAPH